jgi:hypothetical protein
LSIAVHCSARPGITSVKVVEIEVQIEVAMDYAAWVEIWGGVVSSNGGVSSAIASVCM